MAITEAQYEAWLANDNQRRCVLAEAHYHDGISEKVRYFATTPFVSGPADTPANQPYDDLLKDVPEIRSVIDADEALGTLRLTNLGGIIDGWLDDAFAGWPLKLYLGSPDWSRDDFRLVLNGICSGIESPSSSVLALNVKDKRYLLDVPLQNNLLASNEPKPICLGSVFNIEPVLVNAATHTYQVHDGAVSNIVVRDNGVAISPSMNLGNGKFSLGAAPVGRLTCDVVQTTNTAATMIDWLARRVGLVSAEIDSANLAAFANTATLGLYVRDQRTAAECMTDVVRSCGGFYRFDRSGLLQIVRLEAPGASVLSLDTDDVAEGGLTVQKIEQPRSRIRLSYKRNWSAQDADSLAGSVSESNRDLYSREYSTVTADNAAIKTQYPLADEPDVIETLFANQPDAQAEANRRMTMRGQKRIVYKIKSFSAPFQIHIGDTTTVTHPRHGFAVGANAVVVGLREKPTRNRVELEVWK